MADQVLIVTVEDTSLIVAPAGSGPQGPGGGATVEQGAKADTALQPPLIGAANGLAPLDSNQKVPAANLPSTDSISEGLTNQYFTSSRVLNSVLSGLSLLTGAIVSATDSVQIAIGKLQTQFLRRPSITLYYLSSDGADWLPAINRFVAAGNKEGWVPRGDYGLSGTAFLPVGVTLRCDPRGVTFFPLSGGTFVDGWLMQCNTTDGITWTTPLPNMNSGGLYNAKFDNRNAVPAMRGVKAFSSYTLKDCSFDGYRQSFSRPAGFYLDSVCVDTVFTANPQDNTEYQIDMAGLGDGLMIRGLHAPYTVATSQSVKALSVKGTYGGSITDGIGGDYLIQSSGSIYITGHFERAQHIYDSANVTAPVRIYPDTRIPIIVRGTAGSVNNESRYSVDLRGATFPVVEGLMEWQGFHIQQDGSVRLVLGNNAVEWTSQGDFGRCQRSGIRVCQSDGVSPVTNFNNLSYLNSLNSQIGVFNNCTLDQFIRCVEAGFAGIDGASARLEAVGTRNVGVDQWHGPIGNGYYNAQIIYDSTRAIGRSPSGSELTINVPDATKMVVFNTIFGTKPVSGILRLFWGDAPNTYSKFVDIHTMGATWMHDNGLAVNGVAWVARTPGPMGAINSMGESIRFMGQLIEMECAAFPSSAGSWRQGDKIYRTDSTMDANSMLLLGHFRASTGTGQVLGTDWVNMRTSHLSPAV